MNQNKLKILFDNASERIFLINPLGQIIFSNRAANKFFGWSRGQHAIFNLIEATYHAGIHAFLRDKNAKSVSKKKVSAIHQNGSILPVSLILSKVFSKHQHLFLVVITDLFKEKTAILPFRRPEAITNGRHSFVSLYDHQFNCVYTSPGIQKQLGYTHKECCSRSFFDLLHENDRKSIIHEFYEYISGKSIFNSYIYRSIHKDGSPVWIAGTIRTVIDEHGNISGFIINHHVNFIHIKSSIHQPFFAKSSDEMLVLLNRDFHLEFISPACQHLLGYSHDELSAIDFLKILHPDDHNKLTSVVRPHQDQKATENVPALRLKHKNNTNISFEGIVKKFYNNEKQVSNIALQLRKLPEVIVAQDPSGKVQESSFSESDQQLYRHIFEQSKDAILLVDTESTRILNCNLLTVKLFQVKDKSELIGMSIEEFQRQYLQSEELRNRGGFLKNGNTFDVKFLTHSGENFWGDIAVTEIISGRAPMAIVQISDTTLRKQYERELLKAKETAEQIIKAQEKFLSTVSHEIRTPLNAVLGMTHLLLQGQPREDQLKLLETLKFSGDNLISLIDEILDYSKVEAGKLELESSDFNLKKFIQSIKLTYKNLANNKGLIFRLLSEEEIPDYVKGDITRLGQILNNLLSNAVKFTDKGQIVLSIYVEQELEDVYHLLFEVSDTGIGIPEDKLEVVFDPFRQASTSTTRHFGGTGLGLAIVKNLVELHGGKMSVNSTVGEGTVFRITLPFKKADIQFPPSNGTSDFISEYQSLEGLKVLYVEDVLPNQFLMEGLADNWNIELDTALNGLEALEKVRQNKYDLILMDIQMPEMDGFETTQEIRSLQDPHYANIPIVALSASVSETTRERIKITGMDDYISKPINPEDLHRKLSKFSKKNTGEERKDPESKNGTATTATGDYPDFSTLQNLYANDEENYLKILYQIRDLIRDTQTPLTEAIEQRNAKEFKAASHKISSYIKLFKLEHLDKNIQSIGKILVEDAGSVPEDIARQVQHALSELVANIEQKITKIKS